jgi:UPF0755 protein
MNKRSFLSCSTILALSGLCVVVILIFSSLVVIPSQARYIYGQPASGLSQTQRITLALLLLLNQRELTTPVDPATQPREFQVQYGESASTIAQNLQNQGFIWSRDAFMHYLQYSGMDRSLQAGVYSLGGAMNSVEIAHALQDATPSKVDFVILPGWRMEEIAAALPTSGLQISPQEFLSLAGKPTGNHLSVESLPTGATLEGFLFPGSYEMERDTSLTGFLERVLGNFEQNITPDLRQGFNQQGLDIFQAVTLASIIQREAIDPAEMPMIASVFYNRLRARMKLDSDPTVQYALGFNQAKDTWWTNPLSLDDLNTDSPYNTYLYPGLPPGPIANPGLEALRAVAFPGESPFYYFRAACDHSGTHVFSETFEEHVSKACP